MKILKILGVVVAIHAFAFVMIFANPGCSLTTKAAVPATASSSPLPAAAPAPSIDVPLITAAADTSPGLIGGFDPNAPAIAGAARYSPTRPGTAAAVAVQAQPVTNVVPATTYSVVSGDSLWSLAKKNHLTVPELAAANNLNASASLRPGQKLIIPSKSATVPAAAGADGTVAYKVKAGDKLSVIAQRAGTTAAVLKQLNGLKSDTVLAGQDLKLPPGTVMGEAAPVAVTAAAAKPSGDSFMYEVKAGENLSTIARKLEVKQSDIVMANNITNPALIKAGMKLVIPGWQAAPKSTKAADEPPMITKVPSSGPGSDAGPKPSNGIDIPMIKVEEAPAKSSKKP